MYKLGERAINTLQKLNDEQKELAEQFNIVEGQKRSVLETVLKMNGADMTKSWQLTENFELVKKVDNE